MSRRLRRLGLLFLAPIFTCTAAEDEPCAGPIVSDPSPLVQTSRVGADAVQFTVTADGTEPLSYQWRRGTTILLDNARYAGVTTPTLTIRNLTALDASDDYHCVIGNGCDTVTSGAATLSIETETVPPANDDHNPDPIVDPVTDENPVDSSNNRDEDDPSDLASFRACQLLSGPAIPAPPECAPKDFDRDGDVDQDDFAIVQRAQAARPAPSEPTAPAAPGPLDVVIVLDLSLSQSQQSCLHFCRLTEVANHDVWAHLWDTSLAPQPVENGMPAGPSLGNMNTWGAAVTGPGWDFQTDVGLVRLARGARWNLTPAWVSQSLAVWRLRQSAGVNVSTPPAYTAAETAVINSPGGAGLETAAGDPTQRANYRRRVLVGLGIDRWRSGKADGQPGGNGDDIIDAGEVARIVPYPGQTFNPDTLCRKVGGTWEEFVDYVADAASTDDITSNTGLNYKFLQYDPDGALYGDPQLRWHFGLKTFVNYVQERRYTQAESPGLAGGPQQPLRTAIDGIRYAIDLLAQTQNDHQIGLVSFAQVGVGPQDQPDHMSWLTGDDGAVIDKLSGLQAAMWTGNTNLAHGIETGVQVVTSGDNARPAAAKILIVVTDGRPNTARSGLVSGSGDGSPAMTDALAAATNAAAAGVHLHVVGVGQVAAQPAARQFLTDLAEAGGGQVVIASEDAAAYEDQLLSLIERLSQ